MKDIQNKLKVYLATGLLVLAPLAVTVWVVVSLVTWVDEVFVIEAWSPLRFPGLGILFALVLIFLVGLLTSNFIGKWVVSTFSRLVDRVPIVGSIYTGIRQTLTTLVSGSGRKFGRAVLLEFPRSGVWTLGLVTSEDVPPQIQKMQTDKMITVFVPTTPNPTGGYLLFVKESETKKVDIKVDEALKLIVSLGLVEGSDR